MFMLREKGVGGGGGAFGGDEMEETGVRLFLGKRMGITAQSQLGAGVTELRRHPDRTLARRQREAGVGVASIVKSKRSHPFDLGLSAQALP